MPTPDIQGTCTPQFEGVRRALQQNFEDNDELGAAVAVYWRGAPVVDLWGGYQDAERRKTWNRDTLICQMSVAKAVTAFCVHVLADRGLVDLDAPVARYWPEFAAEGKGGVTVAWALSHLASVPVADAAPRGAIFDWEGMTRAIADQKPLWPPGTVPCYHTATQGFLLGEIVRRVSGQTLGTFLRREVSAPLGLDYQIGLTPAEEARCATMIPSAGNVLSAAQSGQVSDLLARGWAQLPLHEDFNSHRWRAGEVPSANGHGTARAIARLYAALAAGGSLDGVQLVRPETMERAWQQQWQGKDVMSGLTFRIALGFYLNCPPDRPMGPSPRAFGHSGAGGAQSFGDPDNQIAFCYTPNRMHSGFDIGPRAQRLIDALFRCL